MGSIESAYMSISLYATRHWGDLTWFPIWFHGMPFFRLYQPGLHLTVAALATLAHWPIPRAYHFLTALAYALAPVTLFTLCSGAQISKLSGFLTAIIYSLFTPLSFLVPAIHADAGAYLNDRRLQILIHYGEGPHFAALAMLPFAILLLHWAVSERRVFAMPLATLALAAVVITNWPGSMGLSMAVIAYLLSRAGPRPQVQWGSFISICLGAYLLVSPWIPPSTVLFVERNAQQSDHTRLGIGQVFSWLAVLLICLLLHGLFRALRVDPWTLFFAYFLTLSGAVTLGHIFRNLSLLPQPQRFEPEMAMALAGVIGVSAASGFKLLGSRPLRWVAIGGFATLCVIQLRADMLWARRQIREIDVTQTIEYRMAKAFERLGGTNRVFAPGNVSLWMNMFTEVPQVAGCCDQSVPTFEDRIGMFVIYSGLNAGAQDASISTLWLQAYGANAVGVTGKRSSEPFQPFVNPGKFNGILRQLWRDGDDVIYAVPQRSTSLAHVVNRSDVIPRTPINGLDIEPLEPYVRAIESPEYSPAQFEWINNGEARITTKCSAGQLLSVQISDDSGWHARANESERPISADGLGMMVIDPQCTGDCTVDLSWEPTPEIRSMHVAQIGVLLLLIIVAIKRGTIARWRGLGATS